jgi:hypothetical protein
MGVPPRVVRGELGKISFQRYLIFMLFIYISIYIYISEYLIHMFLLCADVGPMHPVDFSRTRQCPQLEATLATVDGPTATREPPASEAERVLRRVEQNLTSLTRKVPMAEIEDLPPSMQPHVVEVPRTWVYLFWCLENITVHYNEANRPRP